MIITIERLRKIREMDGWIIKQMGGTKTDECLKEVTFANSGWLYGRLRLLIGG
jgi:hypothetical protein